MESRRARRELPPRRAQTQRRESVFPAEADGGSMDIGGREGMSSAIRPESMKVFREGISLLLSQWSALQMAVRLEWGGCDSRRKCDELALTLLSWFSQSKGIQIILASSRRFLVLSIR
ncbi:hypothetical protein KSP40_PGU006421 [Platanthera guangdongensis]|uniref:Uncharacterized protein n=1 Tax=Platanthera guangdongensis TaxID=2320717 RepID=A0ABR2LLV0_9ASPA